MGAADEERLALLHDRTPEETLVGALLLEPRNYPEAALEVSPEDFASDIPRRAYEALGRLVAAGGEIDAGLVAREAFPEERDLWGAILDMQERAVTSSAWRSWAKQVRSASEKRAAYKAATLAASSVLDPENDSPIATLRAAVDELEGRAHADAPAPFSLSKCLTSAEHEPEGAKTGYETLDTVLGVTFNPGDLVLVAARPGHGKTAILANLILKRAEALEEGEVLLFYSDEEDELRLFYRFLAILASVEGQRIRNSFRHKAEGAEYDEEDALDATEEGRVTRAYGELSRLLEGRVYLIHRPGWNAGDMASHARSIERRGLRVAGVFVDYIQRIKPPAPPKGSTYSERRLEVGATAETFKRLAMELQAPVVAAVQVNRESAGKADIEPGLPFAEALDKLRRRRPALHNLGEAAALDHTADIVLGLMNYRADYQQEVEAGDNLPLGTPFEVGTLKNRYGAVGRWAKLEFKAVWGLLEDKAGRNA